MKELLDIEHIKQLKARYFRSLDTNNWELFADTLTEDCVARYSGGEYSFEGRDSIVGFMATNMSGDKFLSMHNGHHPEIELTGASTADGIWYLEDTVIMLEAGTRLYGTGIYTDKYVKIDNQWKISETSYERIFECVEPLSKHHVVSKNMFTLAESKLA
jgi:hypothetical protein